MLRVRISFIITLIKLTQLLDGQAVEEKDDGCEKDWYYDGSYGECRLCSEICITCEDEAFVTYCKNNCPAYYIKTCRSQRTSEGHAAVSTMKERNTKSVDSNMAMNIFATIKTNDQPQDSNHHNRNAIEMGSNENQKSRDLVNNPLLWVAVVCLIVALLLTLTILLLLFHYSTRSKSSDTLTIRPEYNRSISRQSTCSHCQSSCSNTPERKYTSLVESEGEKSILLPETQSCQQPSVHQSHSYSSSLRYNP